MRKYAVLGFPIEHSLSPQLFQIFAKQRGGAIDYQALEVKPSELPAVLTRLQQDDYGGVNLTLPLKELALDLMDELSPAAKCANSVNVVTLKEDGRIFGENTDGLGFVKDCAAKGIELARKKILILGAGGAVRGVLAALSQQDAACIVLVNRTSEKARLLAQEFNSDKNPVISVPWDEMASSSYDLVIQGTSAAHHGEALALPQGLFRPGAQAYDLNYGPASAAFVARVQTLGFPAHQGLGMLIEQAAATYALWFNEAVDTSLITL